MTDTNAVSTTENMGAQIDLSGVQNDLGHPLPAFLHKGYVKAEPTKAVQYGLNVWQKGYPSAKPCIRCSSTKDPRACFVDGDHARCASCALLTYACDAPEAMAAPRHASQRAKPSKKVSMAGSTTQISAEEAGTGPSGDQCQGDNSRAEEPTAGNIP